MTKPLPADIVADYAIIEASHAKHLAIHKVSCPTLKSAAALWLVYLYRHLGQLVSKEEIAEFVLKYMPGLSGDQQVRHLKGGGWNLLLSGKASDTMPHKATYTKNGVLQTRKAGEKMPNGYYMLLDIHTPSPDYQPSKRDGSLDRSSWEALQKAYDFCCAVCGKKRKLEQGHKDPTKTHTLDNIIPMCGPCNNWASKDVVINDEGRVVALASPKLVKKSALSVQEEIFNFLKKLLGK